MESHTHNRPPRVKKGSVSTFNKKLVTQVVSSVQVFIRHWLQCIVTFGWLDKSGAISLLLRLAN